MDVYLERAVLLDNDVARFQVLFGEMHSGSGRGEGWQGVGREREGEREVRYTM